MLEGKSFQRSIGKIVVTKKIATHYKYVVNFCIVANYFVEAIIEFMAWLLTFTYSNTFSRTTLVLLWLQNGDALSHVSVI